MCHVGNGTNFQKDFTEYLGNDEQVNLASTLRNKNVRICDKQYSEEHLPRILIREHAPHRCIETFQGVSKYMTKMTKNGPEDTIHGVFQKVLNQVFHHRLSRLLSSLETKRNSQMKYWKEVGGKTSFSSKERLPGDFCQKVKVAC